jgi:hypothetical protein
MLEADTETMEAAMNDLEAFLAGTVRRHATATTAVRNGDATSLIAMLSMHDPVTLFPASQVSKLGWAEVSDARPSRRRIAADHA